MNRRFSILGIVLGIALVGLIVGCPLSPDPCQCDAGMVCDPETSECVAEGFAEADADRGGSMYDKWWAVAGLDAPADDHPFWSLQDTNTRTGADTWRCKECHGWAYKGVDGAYGSGSHMTGFNGVFGTAVSAQEAFDEIKDGHGFGAAGLTDDDIWDLAKFVLQGQIDTDDILDGAAFTGSSEAGRPIFESTCQLCHGADGLTPPPGAAPDHEDFVGLIASENPWEFQHKVRFGQPGTAMPPQAEILTVGEVADLGAHAQTLPTSAEPEGFVNGSSTRGGSLYDKWWAVAGLDAPTADHPFWSLQDTNTRTGADTWRCKECHGWDYKGVDGAYGLGSHMTGFAGIFGTTVSPQETFDEIKDGHGLGATGLTDDDIWDLAKFVLQGQIDTDDILDGAAFTGSSEAGQPIYESTCQVCHGADGLAIPPGAAPDHEDFVGLIANENPWEFQHKVRFGQPGTAMPPQAGILTVGEVGDLGAHAQTLPTAPGGG